MLKFFVKSIRIFDVCTTFSKILGSFFRKNEQLKSSIELCRCSFIWKIPRMFETFQQTANETASTKQRITAQHSPPPLHALSKRPPDTVYLPAQTFSWQGVCCVWRGVWCSLCVV